MGSGLSENNFDIPAFLCVWVRFRQRNSILLQAAKSKSDFRDKMVE